MTPLGSVRRARAAAIVAAVTICAAAGTHASFPGTPRPQGATSQTAATGVMVGQVVDASTGSPVGGAVVRLAASPGSVTAGQPSIDQLMALDLGSLLGGIRQVVTDGQGRFAFSGLPGGEYSLTAQKPGWTGGGYRQARLGGGRSPLVLGADARVADVTLRLWKNAALGGTVLDEAGEPVVGVTVRAMGRSDVGGAAHFSADGAAQTDDRGMYRIAGLAAGDYVVVVPQTPITLPLRPAADFRPALVEATGAGAVAAAASRSRLPAGAPPRVVGIRVGDAVLETAGADRVIPPAPQPDGTLRVYTTAFYPAVTDASQASVISLTSGADCAGVDFQLKPARVVAISGQVTGPGGPLDNVAVHLVPKGSEASVADPDAGVAITAAGGRFTLLGVPAGDYTLRMLKTPPSAAGPAPGGLSMLQGASGGVSVMGNFGALSNLLPAPPPIPTEPVLWADQPITVGGTDIADVALEARAGYRLSGRVIFDGPGPPPTADQLKRLPIVLEPVRGGWGELDAALAAVTGLLGRGGQVDADGHITTYGQAPGKYFVRVPFGTAGWTLSAITLGGRHIEDTPVEVRDADINDLVVTLTDRPAELSGVVRTPSGTADPDASVCVYPTDRLTWTSFGALPARFKQVAAQQDGAYRLPGLLPGDYFVIAVPNSDAGHWQNASFLESHARTAARVTIVTGDKKALELTAEAAK